MTRRVRALSLAAASLLIVAAPAGAQSVTRQLADLPCSVTSTSSVDDSTSTMTYAGGVSCAGGVGQKTLDVVPQVRNIINGTTHWYNISLAGRYQGPTPISPLRLRDARPAVTGHVYRVLAYGRVALADGRTAWATACTGTCSGSPELSISGTDRYAPQEPVTVKIGATPCSVTEEGPVFTLVNGSYVVTYGGRVSCTTPSLTKSLGISAEVAGSGANAGTYFTIAGSGLSSGPTSRNPIALSTGRTAFLGHGYRVRASGRAILSGTSYTATALSRTWAP